LILFLLFQFYSESIVYMISELEGKDKSHSPDLASGRISDFLMDSHFMSKCKFYLIRSKKSEEMVDGLQQIALGCENRAEAHGFLWIDVESNIQHIQLLFGEIVIEWFPGKGVKCSRTNRAIEVPEGIGFHKGVRILHPLEDTTIIESVLKEARNADYPPEWSDKILEKF